MKMSANVSEANMFELTIEDDGRGFEGSEVKKNSRGIANIRARASMIGADVAWGKRPSAGTAFKLSLRSENGQRV